MYVHVHVYINACYLNINACNNYKMFVRSVCVYSAEDFD